MFKTEALGIKMAFSIPQWFPPDRLDYSKAYHNPEGHRYAGSYDHSTYHNSAEDNLLKQFKDIKELCKYYWIEFEYDGTPEQLPKWIERTKMQLDNFFKRYKESKE
jgi:hypothetical protein